MTAREITPLLLGLLGGAVDKGVDRLAAHGPQTAFVSGFQPARDLLGRPPFCEAVENEASQGSVFLDRPLGSLLRDSSRYSRAAAGLQRLAEAGVLSKVLCVINPCASGSEVYHHLRGLGVTRMNFLLPDATHDSWPRLYGEYPSGFLTDFLISAFDAWYDEDDPNVHALLFEDVIRSLYGGSALIDVIGNAVPDYLVVDTDGAIQWNDALKVCDEGVPETGLNVAHHSFEAVDQASALAPEVLYDNAKLNARCQKCRELRTCGGGFLPHRYSRARGFDNPSIWCADLLSFISHVRKAVFC